MSARPAALLLVLAVAGCERFERPDLSQLAPGVQQVIAQAEAEFDENLPAAKTAREKGVTWGNLCYRYHAHHLHDAAASCYQQAIMADDKNAKWHYLLGNVQRDRGNLAAAAAAYRSALDLEPGNPNAIYNLGLTLIDLGEPAAARAQLEPLNEREPHPALLAAIGRAALVQQDYRAAADALEAALRLQPGANRLHHPAAMAWRGLGDSRRAARHIAQVGDVEPYFSDPVMEQLMQLSGSAQRYQERGRAALARGDEAAAEREFRSAVAADPDDASSRAMLGLLLERTGRIAAARQELEAAIAAEPGNANFHLLLGKLLERSADTSAAEQAYLASIARDPMNAETRLLLGHLEMRRQNPAGALAHYAVVAQVMQNNLLARYYAGLAALAAGDCTVAADYFERALELQHNYGPVIMALVRTRSVCPEFAATRAANLELARQLYDAAPDNDEVRATLAMALAATGDFAAAAQVQPDKNGYRDNLARYRSGRPAERAWARGAAVFRPPPLGR